MDENSDNPSVVELASVVGGFVATITTITIQLFPFALPLLALTIVPLVVLALAGLLLALPVVVPLWLGRLAWRALRRERRPEPEARPVVTQHRGQLAQ